MAIGIRPTVDFAFKCLLGSPEHMSITVHFLNAVLSGSPRITQATILNPILNKDADDDKLAILDLLVEDEFKRKYNIEMQTSLPTALSQRLLYYASCIYVEQLTEGVNYRELRPVVNICVLEKSLYPQLPDLHLDFRMRDKGGEVLTNDLQIHLIELPKCRATEHNIKEVTDLERWAFFLLNAEWMSAETVRLILPDAPFQEAIGVLEMIQKNPDQRMLYMARMKLQRDEAARMDYAKEAGMAEGLEKGLVEGLAKGKLLGQICTLEVLLGISSTSPELLDKMDLNQLTAVADDLMRRCREQNRDSK